MRDKLPLSAGDGRLAAQDAAKTAFDAAVKRAVDRRKKSACEWSGQRTLHFSWAVANPIARVLCTAAAASAYRTLRVDLKPLRRLSLDAVPPMAAARQRLRVANALLHSHDAFPLAQELVRPFLCAGCCSSLPHADHRHDI